MQKLTKEQAIVLTGYTGITFCNFGDFHKDVEKRLGELVTTTAFAMEKFVAEVKALYKEDFMNMIEGL